MNVEMTKREQMDKIMADTKRRKTRRGKKNYLKRLDNSGLLNRCHNVLTVAKSLLRPALSPPAPFNSNQFLMEDRDSLQFFDSSPSQTLEEKPFSESSRLDLTGDDISLFMPSDLSLDLPQEDSYYEPLWHSSEGDDFMLREFEKDYNATFDLDFHLEGQLNVFDDVPKEQIVEKYMKLEQQYSSKKMNHADIEDVRTPKSIRSLIADMKAENSRLKEENERLKSALLFQ